MSLQYKISALLLAVFMLFGVFTYAVQQRVILPSFLQLETADAERSMERALQGIRRELAAKAQAADATTSADNLSFPDPAMVRRVARQTGVQLAVWPLQDAALNAEQQAVVAELGTAETSTVRESDEEHRVYQILPASSSNPALLLQVTAPRLITAQGRTANSDARVALVVGALVLLLVLLVGLRYLVLRPIADLIVHADEVGRRDDLSIRLNADRVDELGELAREFNQMVERLADARKALLEQSHRAGFAELASGVLHNIGNAITPLKVRVANIEAALRDAPVVELDMALKELDSADTPGARRDDLRAFVELAAREFATLLTTTLQQMAGVAGQIDHVQKILNDQENLSRAARVLKPVDVAKLASDSVKLLGTEVLNAVQIEYDASLRAVGQVLGAPVALQQIVVNLLKNAAESIRACVPAPRVGRIELSAAAENYDGRAMIRLSVSDNGSGIAPENLAQIFKRGFSTKTRPSSGQGLHWCSITTTALGGQITIDSAGTGQGASVSLWLPQA